MKSAIAVAQVILAILVTLGVLLQTPRATGLGGTIAGAGGGMGGGYRRRRGLEQTLLRMTAVFIILFIALSAGAVYFANH